MRVLFSSTEGSGHFNPLLPFIDSCVARGDDVLLVVPPKLVARVSGLGVAVRVGDEPAADEAAAVWRRFPQASRGEAAVLANREFFGRLCTAAMLPALEEACREWRPELILHEPCEYASAVVAARHGIPQAQVGISLAAVEASSLDLAAPALEPYGHETVERLRAAPYLTRFPASLDPSPYVLTRRFREVAERGGELPDWWSGSAAPLVYLTFGSVVGGSPAASAAFRTALDAVDGLPVRVLLTVGRAVDPASLGPVPANVHVEAWVPQADVLGSADLVLCHGGSGTTFGALAAGVPLVVVPLFADQPANGRLVDAAGAGLVVAPSGGPAGAMGLPRAEDVPRIRAAVESVLGDASYRTAAQRLGAEMGALASVGAVLEEVQSLA
ncbi:glycosyltransferase [Kitasatospora mediocidica]|uniref:glycosyltransferase n=1 Tax=Kitasatospora mediocidica TaxID=58352 RepID=UPI00056C3C37|nr:glycosyltransferase [Kitasatospora mediocidica]